MVVRSDNAMTVEQLAAASGMSVRNIRAHQARGLLAPPEVRQRVGYYGPEHVAQLRLIRELQEEGFNLGGIKRLLDDSEGTAEPLLRFKDALRASGDAPALTLSEIAEELGRSGIPPEAAVSILAELERHCDAIAKEFVRLFQREVWKPFAAAGMPSDRWPEIEEAIRRLRPIAADALRAIFEQRMSGQVERAFDDMTRQRSRD